MRFALRSTAAVACVIGHAGPAVATLIPPTGVVVTPTIGSGPDAHAAVTLAVTYRVPLMPVDADFGDAVEVNLCGFAFAAACSPHEPATDVWPSGAVHLGVAMTGRPDLGRWPSRYAVESDNRRPALSHAESFVDRPVVLQTKYLRPDSPDAQAYLPLTVELHADAGHAAVGSSAVVAVGDLTLDVPWATDTAAAPPTAARPDGAAARWDGPAGTVETIPSAHGDLLLVKNFDGPLAQLPADFLAQFPTVLTVPEPPSAGLFAIIPLAAASRRRRRTGSADTMA